MLSPIDLPRPKTDVVLVTGGAGFIGSNLILDLAPRFPEAKFVNLDAVTYAANPETLRELESLGPNYILERVDLVDAAAVRYVVDRHRPRLVLHLAAETHVDRSIHDPQRFLETNVMGTFHLLQACRDLWSGDREARFHHVSTDEVYGSLGAEGKFTETTPYSPRSPYSASKAGSDHLVRAFHETYGLPITITNCSNNYGPRQHPEKLLPLMIFNALSGKPLPVYGDGQNVRDWLYVTDHAHAIWMAATMGRSGETYNVGGDAERTNLSVLAALLDAISEATGKSRDALEALKTFVADRPGHDRRYAIDATKIQTELGWRPAHSLEQGLRETVDWYLSHPDWVVAAQAKGFDEWVIRQYGVGGRP
jgi:dTDP-glucose 4,6-dehydratase